MNWKTMIAAGAILLSGITYAQTPDGVTPANEGICDELISATPGLYGLCIAYCEAQDFDSFDPEEPGVVEKAAPKLNILRNYNKKMKAGDPSMPCIQAPIPCWTEEELDSMGTADNPGFRTVRHTIYNCPDGAYGVGETWYIEEQGVVNGLGKQIWAGAWYKSNTGLQGCWFVDGFNDIGWRRFNLDTVVQYEQAVDSIHAQAYELGWTVPSWRTRYPEDAPCR